MSETVDTEGLGVQNALLRLYLEDQRQGGVKPLEAYQRAFPGYEELVARLYARLERAEGGGPGGERVGPYRLVSVLGEGGMGVVYLAEQTEGLRRQVALKLVKPGMDTREVLARFEAERQALALMSHESIARVFDAGTTAAGRPYFAMELVPGVPITAYCDQSRLSTRERLGLFLRVCEGVQHAHQKGIIHRDLKPSNVLVVLADGKPVPKIIDFGIAKSVSRRLTEETLFTEQGQIIGTPEYMSPEQVDPGPLDIDTRADIYSLGVLLYQLVAGALPFDLRASRRAGCSEVIRRLREDDPPRPSTRFAALGEAANAVARCRRTDPRSLLRDLRGDLDWIAMKAMDKDRARRYAAVSELAADVRRHLDHEPVVARPPSLRYRAAKLARRHRLGLTVCLGIALLAAGSVAATRYAVGQRHLRESEAHLTSGKTHRQGYRQLREELRGREAAWKEARRRHASWLPAWELQEVLEAGREVRRTSRGLEAEYSQAVVAFHAAWQKAPPGSAPSLEARRALEGLYWVRYQEGLEQGEVRLHPELFRSLIDTVGLGTHTPELERGEIRVETVPEGAEVFCFQYEEHEGRLVPIPFDPRLGVSGTVRGRLGEPRLVVEKVWRPELSSFREGDRFLAVNEREVRLPRDVARALEEVQEGEAVPVLVLRSGEEIELSWTPFTACAGPILDENGEACEPYRTPRTGEVLRMEHGFGFSFAGYPLDLQEGCRLGRTPLDLELARGSYLLVFQLAGHAGARCPVAIPQPEKEVKVVLLAPGDVPEGFVYVPGGPFSHGEGGGEAFQALEPGRSSVPGFIIGRHEVTVREYLEFLNDAEVLSRIQDDGRAEARADWSFLRENGIAPESRSVQLVPRYEGRGLLFQKSAGAGRWEPAARLRRLDWPVLSVSVLAGLEYAHWLTEKEGKGRWRFRLPTDLEWEKAARGADRRTYVWGDDPVWSYCASGLGNCKAPPSPGPVGANPFDESVYGVRDLAGSVYEPTTGVVASRFTAWRGGNWFSHTEYFFHAATRNGLLPGGAGIDGGLRIACDVMGR
ncbi:MAG: protein kinase [Planctomycetes bacterium]|nr:protein kinase [Planctomycetota bacterium]